MACLQRRHTRAAGKGAVAAARATFEVNRAPPTLRRNSRVFPQAAAAARIAGKTDIWDAAEKGDLALVKDHLVLQPALLDQADSFYGFDP